ncbi:diaminobutyrate acetyltransferase [Desmospora activa DSM 45169]|uniref:L-2,4-diaminobutyric acid acetyltransferase n=2 Tax=Desmospora TaxID=500614 RepID=A0A2T4ZCK3_9BACL|nr:diaminobutyrate acetyltransferase [Desmospora activa DSM 45169]
MTVQDPADPAKGSPASITSTKDPVLSADITRFRAPRKEDGLDVWRLIKEAGTLDLNSPYSYLMLCDLFSDTCVIAEEKGKIVGFVSAFLSPDSPDTIFIWQVGVAQSQRGKGLGKRLLREVLRRKACAGVRFLEATVSPSNIPSQSLFRSLAREKKTNCRTRKRYGEELFPGNGHEAEWTFRIGPLNKTESTKEVL